MMLLTTSKVMATCSTWVVYPTTKLKLTILAYRSEPNEARRLGSGIGGSLGCTLREECQLLREYIEGSTWNEIEDVKRGSRREIEKRVGRQKERGTGWEAADRGVAWTEDVFKSYENATEKGHDSADRSGVGVEIRIWLEAWWWGWRNCS